MERGFRFLKDPLFFADSLFLKKPVRIMALLMVMGLSLLVYALAERKLRTQLVTHDEHIPDQKGQPTQRPTMRRIFQMFEGIDVLLIWIWMKLILARQLTQDFGAFSGFQGHFELEFGTMTLASDQVFLHMLVIILHHFHLARGPVFFGSTTVLVSDNHGAYADVVHTLGVEHQICRSHVKRNVCSAAQRHGP